MKQLSKNTDELRQHIHGNAEHPLQKRCGRRHVPAWSEIGGGVCLAAVLYLVIQAHLLFGWSLLYGGMRVSSGQVVHWSEVLTAVIAFAMVTIIGGLAGGVLAGVLCFFVFPVAMLSVWLLRVAPTDRQVGVVCGGAVAYLATLPWSYGLFCEILGNPTSGWGDAFQMLQLVSAMMLGMIGGALGGVEGEHAARQSRFDANDQSNRPRFSIAQLMGLMVAASVLLAALRAADLLNLPMLLATLVWLGVQMLGHRPAMAIAQAWDQRKHRRRQQELDAAVTAPEKRSTE